MALLSLAVTLTTAGPARAVPTIAIGPDPGIAGYVPLSLFGLFPEAGVLDDGIFNVVTPAFSYAGRTWTSVGFASNGFLVVGGGTNGTLANQSLPDSTAPNNILAPFWTDLNPVAAGGLLTAVVTDGTDSWVVFDWDGVPESSTPGNLHSFQVWIGIDGDGNPGEDITFAYGPNTGTGSSGFLTIGAEDITGTVGALHRFNGSGAIPLDGDTLRVATRDFPAPSSVSGPSALLVVLLGGSGLVAFRHVRDRHRSKASV